MKGLHTGLMGQDSNVGYQTWTTYPSFSGREEPLCDVDTATFEFCLIPLESLWNASGLVPVGVLSHMLRDNTEYPVRNSTGLREGSYHWGGHSSGEPGLLALSLSRQDFEQRALFLHTGHRHSHQKGEWAGGEMAMPAPSDLGSPHPQGVPGST